ncbi:THO complex subunit 5 homolog [Anoplophora glabripennis]|uniref:THO complex subunit 5 homolog n=1 Tax=Anoplophora glabripennis TaxID=217634 RepID=UPI000C777164|nr:THO complex subunit 5 homolog [Anoplophora glabripennis]
MQALIAIKNSYPEVPPIFSLCLNYNGIYHSGNCDDIRDLERILNVEWEHGEASSSWLLSAQIYHLCCYLDVYLESLDPKAFPQNVMFLKNICGRNRKRPFKFRKVGTGLFSQY